ncbi:MAG: SpoIIE family protein phosphatase [Candidatus Eisenbacteria bacterium]|nr:SpoIIE family protein phosphatase [Candidatus Eisenbacteria bacterium]
MQHKLTGEVNGRSVELPLREGDQVVGRGSDVDLRIDHPNVSRRHASVTVDGNVVTVTDLGSRNGTRVNGERITGPHDLEPGAVVAFADVRLRLEGGAVPRPDLGLNATAVATSTLSIIEQRAPGTERRGKSGLFRVLAEAGEFLVADRPLDRLYEDVLDLVEGAITCDRVVLLSIEGGASEPTVTASRIRRGAPGEGLTLSKTMIRQVLDEGVSLLTTDAQEDERFAAQASVIDQGVRAAMAAPLFDNQQIIGLLYADTTDPRSAYSDDELRTFTALANLIAVKITQSRLTAAEKERLRLERELRTAREIIDRILPESVEGADGYDVAVYYEPCTEVGGDLYDVRHLEDGRTVIVAGDVAGKGLGAAVLVSSIVPSTRLLLSRPGDLADAAAQLNRQVFGSTDAVRYATLFFGVLDRETGRLDYVNAGHNAPVLVSPAGDVREIAATGVPIGLMENAPFASETVTLEPGALLAAFSDGIDEALGPDDEFYETERIRRLLADSRASTAADIVDRAVSDVRSFTEGAPQSDDIVLLVVKRAAADA